MATVAYDEDILENKFFAALQTHCPELYAAACANRWLICVPRSVHVARSKYIFQENDFQNHILIPVDINNTTHKTAGDKEVIFNGKVITTGAGFEDPRQVNVLFEEIFYNERDESHRILCIDRPLEGMLGEVSDQPVLHVLNTYEDCIELLWGHTGSGRTRRNLDKVIDAFGDTFAKLDDCTPTHLVDVSHALFSKAMQVVLRDSHLKQASRHNDSHMGQIKVAVETYVLHKVYRALFRRLLACVAKQDAKLNKITRNLSELQLKDLGVRQDVRYNIPKAKKELLELNRYTTPLGKLSCIKRVINALMQPPRKGEAAPLTTDDILPALVFMVVKSEIPNWCANLSFVNHFRFSKANNDDEFGFFATSVEAAIQHVASGELDVHRLGVAPFQMKSFTLSTDRQSSRASNIDLLFQFVQNGDERSIQSLLNKHKQDAEQIKQRLCHPLCSCDKCERLVSQSRQDEATVSAFSRNDRGFTALHVAAFYESPGVVRHLVDMGAVVDAADYQGMTPLHISCQKGHQKTTLLLLHHNADPNLTDNDGNSPLHLCSANGHDECVKALLFFDRYANQVDVNKANDYGDTALHIAAKWGFDTIIADLLDHGASVEARNRKKRTPLHCAHNTTVLKRLQAAAESATKQHSDSFVEVDMPTSRAPTQETTPVAIRRLRSDSQYEAVSPLTSETGYRKEQRKHLEKLLKAVTHEDVELVKFYLGWTDDSSEEEDVDVSTRELCHPLCQCDQCKPVQKRITSPSGIGVNSSDVSGYSPLYVSSCYGHNRLTELLVKHGANVNIKTRDTEATPLHAACQYNKPKIVKLLVEHDARVNVKDAKGNTPLHLCGMKGAERAAMILLQKQAKVNLANWKGNTPLHEAACWNFLNMVELLLKHGADVNTVNRQHLTPLQLAQGVDVTEMLEEAMEKEEPLSIDGAVSTVKQTSMRQRLSMRDIFAAVEDKDIEKMQELMSSIEHFHRRSSLKRAVTADRSAPCLDDHVRHQLGIRHFDRELLRHVTPPGQSDRVSMVDPVSIVNPVSIVDPVNIVKPVTMFDPVSMVDPVNIVNPVTMVDPVNMVDPVDIVNPVNMGMPVSVGGQSVKQDTPGENAKRGTHDKSRCNEEHIEAENSNTESCDEIV